MHSNHTTEFEMKAVRGTLKNIELYETFSLSVNSSYSTFSTESLTLLILGKPSLQPFLSVNYTLWPLLRVMKFKNKINNYEVESYSNELTFPPEESIFMSFINILIVHWGTGIFNSK